MVINKKLIQYNQGGRNNPKYIVIHDTGNSNIGANAYSHFKYFSGGDRGSSAHYFVDDGQVIQIIEDNVQSWHNGKKYGPNPPVAECNNSNSIGVEICINDDGNYSKALANAIELTKELMAKHNIHSDRVIRHYDSCLKQCPGTMMRNPSIWDNFKKQLDPVKEPYKVDKIKVEINGQVKEVSAINVDGTNYVKLRDLASERIEIDYNADKRIAVVKTI